MTQEDIWVRMLWPANGFRPGDAWQLLVLAVSLWVFTRLLADRTQSVPSPHLRSGETAGAPHTDNGNG